MRISDWSSDVCSSDLAAHLRIPELLRRHDCQRVFIAIDAALLDSDFYGRIHTTLKDAGIAVSQYSDIEPDPSADTVARAYGVCQAHEATMQLAIGGGSRSEEHTSELQSLMRISYAVFCLKKK